MLPNNPASQKIIKEREEIKAAEDERIRIVSYTLTEYTNSVTSTAVSLIRKRRSKTKLKRIARESATLSKWSVTIEQGRLP